MITKNDKIEFPPGVLKIKKGYNPNSSSVGTVLYAFPLALPAIGAVLAALAVFIKKDKKTNEDKKAK